MLNKTESKVMGVLFNECKQRSALLISPLDLIKISGEKGLTESKLDRIMNDLFMDGYFDLIYSDRHGERVYCVTLTEKGKGYLRGRKVMKRNLLFRLGVTVALAIVSFVIGLILKAIF
jgi:DNA-binding MarR family transcriptional regulator